MELEETKAEIYETWAVINRAFEQIIAGLEKLQKKGVLPDDCVQDQGTITNDLWARINTQILAEVGKREEDDRSHYEKCGPRLRDGLGDGNEYFLKRPKRLLRVRFLFSSWSGRDVTITPYKMKRALNNLWFLRALRFLIAFHSLFVL
jgi:hypothetical protein